MTKIAMRNAWFQVHKWIGLILAILIIPLCVTGSALVWDEALDHQLNPQRYATSGATTIDPQRLCRCDPGRTGTGRADRVAQPAGRRWRTGDRGGEQAGTRQKLQGPPARTTVWLDPPTARVLDHGNSGTGLIRTMHMIHGTLLVPGVGRQIVGWIGVAMMISCFTGLWLWWPTVGRWVRGLRWRRHRNTDTNLHHLLGFWVALPLFALSLTGAWISFPKFFGGGPNTMGMRPTAPRPVPLETTRLSVDTVIASVQAAQPGDVRQVSWPTDQKAEWKVMLAGNPAPSMTVDEANGAAKPGRIAPEDTARLMRRIHDGTRMGLAWQIIIFLGGILPAVLAVTGIIMWWRARGWKAELKARQARTA